MRTYRITIDERTYLVEIEDPNACPVEVRVDGKAFQVSVDWEGSDDGAAVGPEVCAEPVATAQPVAQPAARPTAQPPRGRAVAEKRQRQDEAAGSLTITAPMPGTILSVAVSSGAQVSVGQEICVLEAMKMKNSVRSPREGRVANIAVSAGETVAHGDLIARFEE